MQIKKFANIKYIINNLQILYNSNYFIQIVNTYYSAFKLFKMKYRITERYCKYFIQIK